MMESAFMGCVTDLLENTHVYNTCTSYTQAIPMAICPAFFYRKNEHFMRITKKRKTLLCNLRVRVICVEFYRQTVHITDLSRKFFYISPHVAYVWHCASSPVFFYKASCPNRGPMREGAVFLPRAIFR